MTITITCPLCNNQCAGDDSLAGQVIACPSCHQNFQAGHAGPQVVRRRGINPWLIVGIILLFVMPFAALGTYLVIQPAEPNASCWYCGKRFRISEEYRNNRSRYFKKIRCPRCGKVSDAHMLYD